MNFFITTSFMFLCYASLAYPINSSLGSRSNLIEDDSEIQNPYITDGLVAMWDGIWNAGLGIHDSDATIWKDLAGNADLILTEYGLFDDNSLISTVQINDTSTLGAAYGTFTGINATCCMECVFKYTGGRKVAFGDWIFTTPIVGEGIRTSSNANAGFAIERGLAALNYKTYVRGNFYQFYDYPIILDTNINIGIEIKSLSANLISGVLDSGFENGYSINLIYNHCNSSGRSKQILIGTDQWGRWWNGNIYSIRFYSRNLTADEVAHNHSIDKARFGL